VTPVQAEGRIVGKTQITGPPMQIDCVEKSKE